jgi:putative ABC transport system permease protein
MITSYIKSAWRNITKNKAFSFINIAGLALGISSSLFIFLWVYDEATIDKFHKNDARLYSVFERQYHDGQIDAAHNTPGLLADEMKATLPEVEYAAGVAWKDVHTFQSGEKTLKFTGTYAGADFFKVFSYPLVAGTADNALKSSVDIAISKKMAESFFTSSAEAFGKVIRFDDMKDLKVAAVFEDLTSQSSQRFDFIVNWETFLERHEWARNWGNNAPATYVVLKQGTEPTAFEAKIADFISHYDKNQNPNFIVKLGLQKFSDRYLHSNFKDGELAGGRIQYVKLFTVVAVFILVIACINFMNLSSARSIKRAKEIGVRKVVGAHRKLLIRQFIGEAMFTVFVSCLIALFIVFALLPLFNEITRKEIAMPIEIPDFWLSLLILTTLTGFIAGSYPALYLSSFNPVKVLKGTFRSGSGALLFRKGLVVFQFVLSVILIISTIIISRQVDYVQSMNIGFERENIIYLPIEGDLPGKYDVFKQNIINVPGVKNMTRMSAPPTSIVNSTGGVTWPGKDPSSVVQFTQAAVGYDFLKTLGIHLVEGRDFSESRASDSVGYIINETALKIIGYKNAVGMPLTQWGHPGQIIGVVKDFHFSSVHSPIKPLILRLNEHQQAGVAVVKIEAHRTADAIASLESICRELNPSFPFTFQFADEEYRAMYTSELIVKKLSNIFASLAIIVSCLGLLGLAMFAAEQRTKEIGIRKVLGASSLSLFNLLSKDLLIPVCIALLIASPVAWTVMNDWLSQYAYRIDFQWHVFIVAGALAILIALLTISFQTIKALIVNPATSLRSE